MPIVKKKLRQFLKRCKINKLKQLSSQSLLLSLLSCLMLLSLLSRNPLLLSLLLLLLLLLCSLLLCSLLLCSLLSRLRLLSLMCSHRGFPFSKLIRCASPRRRLVHRGSTTIYWNAVRGWRLLLLLLLLLLLRYRRHSSSSRSRRCASTYVQRREFE